MERTLYAVPSAIPMIALLGATDANLRIVEAQSVAPRCNIFDLHPDNVTTSQFAIDRQIKQRQITFAPFDLQHRPN